MSEYPEHVKLTAIQAQSQKVGEFLEWLQCDKHVKLLVSYGPETDKEGKPVYRDLHGELVEGWRPSSRFIDRCCNDYKEALRRERDESIEQQLRPDPHGAIDMPLRQQRQELLAEFFEIDPVKLEEEKRQMLAECRAVHSDGD